MAVSALPHHHQPVRAAPGVRGRLLDNGGHFDADTFVLALPCRPGSPGWPC
ncbi:hypothetical protein MUN84_21800 [Hymenobacter sp. 5516J-16]|uniref:hypothetical protein n=1 Tax=Hymenobacter sp. 5516J-16 TaxID=2932253 RepID=UPI001FD56D2B|nr:hypothetical protein [Hymenobacter sp. 5516J-16]UOQ77058.1 hypothetical protein MUN84_21800 [Hymenobacter sp. 5516J-16]